MEFVGRRAGLLFKRIRFYKRLKQNTDNFIIILDVHNVCRFCSK